MVKPGGTGSPAFVISARPAPLPPRSSFILPFPSALPPPKKYTYWTFLDCGTDLEWGSVTGVALILAVSLGCRLAILSFDFNQFYRTDGLKSNAEHENALILLHRNMQCKIAVTCVL